MRIERIRIENYRRFKEVDLEIPDGVTALVGRNGAGKSTLLEAIGWCLYGMDAARTEKDLVKRRGAAPGDDVRVMVEFRLGPHAYIVTRELLGKSGSHVATVLVDGKVVVPAGAQSAKESVAYLTRALHMDSRGFFTSLVAKQGELAALTDAKPAERRKVLMGLLRLDAVDDAIQAAREARRDLRARLDGLSAARLDVPTLQKTLLDANGAVEVARVRVVDAATRVDALVEQVEDARARRDASRKVNEAHRQATSHVQLARERLQFVLKDVQRTSVDLEQARVAAGEAQRLRPRVDALPAARAACEALALRRQSHAERERLFREVAQADEEVARATTEAEVAQDALAGAGAVRSMLERALAQRPALEAALQDAQRRAAEARAGLTDVERRLREADARLASIRALGPQTPCPTCTRPLAEHHDQLLHGFESEAVVLRDALRETRESLHAATTAEAARRADAAALAERESELRQKATMLDRQLLVLDAHRKRAADAAARSERLKDALSKIAPEPFDPVAYDAAKRTLDELERDRERHARVLAVAEREPALAASLLAYQEAESAARAAEAEAARARDALGFDPVAHDAVERSTALLEGQLGEARIARERALGEQARRQDEAGRLVDEIARQEALAAQAAALEADARVLERLCGDDGLLHQFRDHLVGRIRPMLTAHAGKLFRELTEGRYADLEVAEDYDLRVHDDGEAFALARFSGGEADLANLCLRLAVSQVVAERAGGGSFQLLALDEVFGSQDETRKAGILRALKALSGRFRQVLLITHVDDVKEAAEHVLRVTALDDGTSRVTVEA